MIRCKFSTAFWSSTGFVLLAVLVAAAYGPSLGHVARGDQINYLAELSSRHGFVGTVLDTVDINRTRTFAPGDPIAFRPLLFFILGLEKYIFGYHFMGWQAVALLAHLFVCGALYALLCRIRGGLFAFLATGMFALAPVNIEPVTWHHIMPYLLFAGCVLMALRYLYAAEQGDAKAGPHAAVGWMLPAVFLYEAGIWYALCMGAFLWLRGRRCAAYVMGALVIFYIGVSAADLFWRHAFDLLRTQQVSGQGSVFLTLTNMVLLGKWFLSAFFFLGSADLLPMTRMMVRPEVVGWAWPWGQTLSITIGMGLAALTAVIAVFGQSVVRRGIGRNGAMVLLCFAMMAGNLAAIAVGRINAQGEFGMRVGLYYPYNFLVLALAAFALALPRAAAKQALSEKSVKVFASCIIVALVISYALAVHRVTAQMARDHRQNRVFLAALDRYVKAHEKEPGFSFYIGPEYPGNYTADWVVRLGDPPGRPYTVAEALYFSQFTRNNPKYVIKFER